MAFRTAPKANTTDKERAGLALHFDSCDHRSSAGASAGEAQDHQPILTGPRATGGVLEFGQPIAGAWDAQIARLSP